MEKEIAMRTLGAVAAGLLWLATAAGGQSYHEPKYLVGGDVPSADPTLVQGMNLLDLSGPAPALTQWLQPGFTSRFVMDRDNRQILVMVQGTSNSGTLYAGPKNGMFRFDPVTKAVTTLVCPPWNATIGYHSYYHAVIDHNGDYICGGYDYDRLNSQNSGYYLFKVTPSGVVRTLLHPRSLGREIQFYGKLERNINSGHVLVCDMFVRTSPTTIRNPILEVDVASGFVFTFSTGGAYGWYGFYGAPQNHRTGDIEGPYGTRVFRVSQGNTSRTTVAVLPGLPYPIYGGNAYDLQTAASPRVVSMGYRNSPPETWFYALDAATWTVTSTSVSTLMKTNSNGFEFYEGRHTQTVLNGRQIWDILLSAPAHPNRPYAIAVGISGVAPGLPLKDGRRINQNLDNAVVLSVQNRFGPLFNPGPGVLDSSGRAKARLNLSPVGSIGIPCWIAWLVIDPNAPLGIAYIPDTYVMRI
jgi:hypothetical protein